MDLIKKAFDAFVYSSLFIACGAVLMTWQTAELFSISLSPALAFFVFSGTIASYNFHWFLTPGDADQTRNKERWSQDNRQLHFILSIISLVAAMYCASRMPGAIYYLSSTAFFTFLYSAPKIPLKSFRWLKKIAIGKTIYLALAWTHVTCLIPFLVEDAPISTGAIYYLINRFFFIFSICILFDYRDREKDRSEQVRSLVTRFNEKGINTLFYFSIVACILSLYTLSGFLPFLNLMALGLPVLPLSLLFSYFKKHRSDLIYYFVLDGLMILSAPMLVLAKFAR